MMAPPCVSCSRYGLAPVLNNLDSLGRSVQVQHHVGYLERYHARFWWYVRSFCLLFRPCADVYLLNTGDLYFGFGYVRDMPSTGRHTHRYPSLAVLLLIYKNLEQLWLLLSTAGGQMVKSSGPRTEEVHGRPSGHGKLIPISTSTTSTTIPLPHGWVQMLS